MPEQFQKIFFISLLLLFPLFCSSYAQDLSGTDKEIFDRGVFHFEKMDYRNGLSYFRELINKYPRDPVFNYYSGVSMVELMIDLETAIRQLQLASLKNVPRNVYYYLGKAFHIQQNFNEAIRYYERFSDYGDKNEIRDRETVRMIDLCRKKAIPGEWKVSAEGEISQREDIPESSYDILVGEALKFQAGADSVRRIANQKRNTMQDLADDEERESVEEEIRDLERVASSLQDEANEKYEIIRQMEEEQPVFMNRSYFGEELEPDEISSLLAEEFNLAPGAMLGRQVYDETYFQTHLSILLTGDDTFILDDLDRTNRSAIQNMRDAARLQGELDQQKLKVSGARNKRERNRAMANIRELENRILATKYDAIIKYQEVNSGIFRIFEDKILALSTIAIEDERKSIAEEYHRQALRSYDQALRLQDEAKDISGKENKYDKLAEANAYELIAVENQKRGYATLAGILPVPEQEMLTVTGGKTGMDEEPVSGKLQKEVNQEDTDTAGEKVKEKEKTIITEELIREKLSADRKEPVLAEGNTVAAPDPRYQSIPLEYGMNRQSFYPYSEWDPIPLDRMLPGGVVYRIQIGAFRNPVSPDFFGKLFPVSAETDPEKGFIRYYAGLFRNSDDAEKALPEVKSVGFNDAFIVAHFQERKITLLRAKELEEIYGTGEGTRGAIQGGNEKSRNRENPVYRILLGFFPDRLSRERLNTYQEITGNLRIQYLKNIEGEYIFTIGNFLTFEEAETQKRILGSKGLEGLVTLAFIGNRIIRDSNR
ncbi:MAG: SPOR domain-containing protein [Bacteroidales bacterium]|nr:MAG: SPOR domain-containing protein [Bacteroidales bacterium]